MSELRAVLTDHQAVTQVLNPQQCLVVLATVELLEVIQVKSVGHTHVHPPEKRGRPTQHGKKLRL